jgi:hypothetical protein
VGLVVGIVLLVNGGTDESPGWVDSWAGPILGVAALAAAAYLLIERFRRP